MATIRSIQVDEPSRDSRHTEVDAVLRAGVTDGEKFIQIDTYGSSDRQMEGKISQPIRLTKDVFEFIKLEGERHF